VRNGVSEVTTALKMAQGMAARDGRPRGVRFIVGPTNVDKPDSRWITELQSSKCRKC